MFPGGQRKGALETNGSINRSTVLYNILRSTCEGLTLYAGNLQFYYDNKHICYIFKDFCVKITISKNSSQSY